jgi:hypothetical protein
MPQPPYSVLHIARVRHTAHPFPHKFSQAQPGGVAHEPNFSLMYKYLKKFMHIHFKGTNSTFNKTDIQFKLVEHKIQKLQRLYSWKKF